jgi:hypothetical protein
MTKTSKIIATIAVVFIFLILNGMLQAGNGPGGKNLGIIGLVFMFGLIAGLRAIWKSPKKEDSDNTTLNKN